MMAYAVVDFTASRLMLVAGGIAACACLLGIFTPLHARSGSAPQSCSQDAEERDNLQIVRSAFARWGAGGNVFDGLLAENVVWTIHGSGSVAGTYKGLRDFTERAAQPLVRRLSTPLVPTVHFMVSDRDRVIVRFGGAATTTSGKPYRNEFLWIFRMDGGRVVEAEAFLDLAAYQRVIDSNEPHARM